MPAPANGAKIKRTAYPLKWCDGPILGHQLSIGVVRPVNSVVVTCESTVHVKLNRDHRT